MEFSQQLLQEMDGATGVSVEASFFQSLFNELLKGGEILGSLRAGVYWTPTVCDLLTHAFLLRTMGLSNRNNEIV